MLSLSKQEGPAHVLCFPAGEGKPVRYGNAERVLRLALAMQGSAEGLSLQDIQREFEVSRRTAERMRDAVGRLFPQMEEGGERTKRWRIRGGAADALAKISAEDLAALAAAAALLRRDGRDDRAAVLDGLATTLRSRLKPERAWRVEPDLEALVESEGLALRPGPRPRVKPEVVAALRDAILACRKVRLHYRARGSSRLSRQLVSPYGFLYGARHYLVAWSANPQARDYRLYSLANIERAEPTPWVFERRRDFSLRDYAQRSFGVFQEAPMDVVWRFSPTAAPDAREFLFHPTQTLEDQPDGSLLVRFRAAGLTEMCWHLFTWGPEVEILEPAELRERYQGMIEELGCMDDGEVPALRIRCSQAAALPRKRAR